MLRQQDRLFRVGLAGCGSIAPLHVQGIKALDDAELVAFADPDPRARARLVAYSHELDSGRVTENLRCYEDLAKLIQNEKPDVVHICTPHHTHVPLAILSLEQGCHVLMEKPPAITLNGLQALEKAVASSQKTVGVCFQNRFNPSSIKAKHLLTTGKIGPVRAARAFVTWKRDAAYYAQASWRGRWATEGGGVMINQAIHTLDLMIWLAGRPVKVEGTLANRHLRGVIEVEDTAEMMMTLENGVAALFYATTAYGADAPVFLELDCGRNRLRLEGDNLFLLDETGSFLPPAVLTDLLNQEPARVPFMEERNPLNDGKACWGQGHQRLIRAFYDSLKPGQEAFPIDLESGSLALKALLALYESHRSKKTVTVI